MSNPDRIECVGTLLVHSKDVQELSVPVPATRDECVGSLLVHQSDVQEVSAAEDPGFAVNLQKRVSAGTLLVPSSDLQSPQQDSAPQGSLRRRITDRLNGPPPKDDEADKWVD